ncbi:MAG: penicillin-binding protein 2 [Candidatus Delongbacteria bacterium]|nr:penicillin-binding protein 2 [Candidatus Delongbacteria bacterium]
MLCPLFIQLFNLQIIRYQLYYRESDRNRIRLVSINAPRGLIYDRNHRIVALNTNSYTVSITPYKIGDRERTLKKICSILELDTEKIMKIGRVRSSYKPIPIARNVDYERIAMIEEHKEDLKGIDVERGQIRYYLFNDLACHIIGYLNEVSEEEIDKLSEKGYSFGDLIGRSGVESEYENLLRGRDGIKLIEVNAMEREIGEIYPEKTQFPKPGHNITLSIDMNLQRKAEELLSPYNAGALVMLHAKTGQILVLANHPRYNLNMLSGTISSENWNSLINDPYHPMFNRAISSRYPPGSVYKVVTAAAAIEVLGFDEFTTQAPCIGYYSLGNRDFKCWNLKGHGSLNLLQAMAQSCDVYFYQLGLKLGLENMYQYSLKMNLGQVTGIDLQGESKGLIPNDEYYRKKLGNHRFPRGILLNLSIGQGEILVTPIQMAHMMNLIGNNGHGFAPHLLVSWDDPASSRQYFNHPKPVSLDIQPQTLSLIQKSLLAVVYSGTGGRASVEGLRVAGKTGSAENPGELTHAWFAGYAPYEAPEVAFACVLENVGHGGSMAAPIVGQLLSYYYDSLKVTHDTY